MIETKVSPAAFEAWSTVIKQLFTEVQELQQVIVPIVSYRPGKKSDDGARDYMEPLVITLPDVEVLMEIMSEHLTYILEHDETNDIALNRNVMLIQFAKPPRSIVLDIIDVGSEYNEIVHLHQNNYNILKTINSYHMYAKTRVDSLVVNGGYCIKDDKWVTGFIRVTESEEKGPITKHEKQH